MQWGRYYGLIVREKACKRVREDAPGKGWGREKSQEDEFMSEKKTTLGESGIYDARALGAPKVAILGLQHMFAMFGSTILVPILTGLDVSTTLLFAGLGTLLFQIGRAHV